MRTCFAAVALILTATSPTFGDFTAYHYGVLRDQVPLPFSVINDQLQPFSVTIPGRGLHVISPSGRGVNLGIGDIDVTLINPVPVGDFSSSLVVSNFAGSWSVGKDDGISFQASGTYDVELDIVSAVFGPDPNATENNVFIELNSSEFIVDEIMLGDQVQIQGNASINNVAVPEPSQYLAFGLISVGLIIRRLLLR